MLLIVEGNPCCKIKCKNWKGNVRIFLLSQSGIFKACTDGKLWLIITSFSDNNIERSTYRKAQRATQN